MAFQLKTSNSLEHLAEGFCQDLQSARVDVFLPHIIVTQTLGMNNWLNIQIAERLGIAANCRYLKPNDLIYRIYFLLGGKAAQTLSIQNMTWLLYQLLGSRDFTDKFPEIARYYQGAATSLNYPEDSGELDVHHVETDAVKRLALARKIADLFDQYQIYRADMMAEWNMNTPESSSGYSELPPEIAAMTAWQLYLWQRARQIAGDSFPDKIKVAREIEMALQDPDKVAYLQRKMPAIYFFGISLLTSFHLRIFEQLSDYVHLYLYLLNPAPADYWFDDLSDKRLRFLKRIGKADASEQSTGHPLLLSWGKIIQDTFSMLFQNDEVIAGYEELNTEEPPTDTLLHIIQHAIFHNQPTAEITGPVYDPLLKDGSIIINACYSPIREVEVLYNYLVHLIDQRKETLTPRDIVVMVSDIDLYAAYIKAVFEHAPYTFPYKIADERFIYSDSISSALESILALDADNFTSETVIRLLDSGYIRNRLQISDLQLVRTVLEAANIRFGMEGSFTDDSRYVSWMYGLKRIMYGICISGGEEIGSGPESFFPVDLVEGSDTADMIRFVHFAEQLMESIRERQKPRTLDDWSQYIEEILTNFICNEEDITDDDYQSLLLQLNDYNTTKTIFAEPVSFHVFWENFKEGVTGAARSHSFGTGGVTFCSLIPMRSIPFKVVALLGLNFDKFPRKEHPLGFNLMEKDKKKGDRNVKENDKHLFLETLLSAKEYFYISYLGQSIKDNSAIPPSTLIDELVDYIAGYCSDPQSVRAGFITRQPLHGFSGKYFSPEFPELYTYLAAPPETVSLRQNGPEKNRDTTPSDHFNDIQLDQLIRFYKHPAKGYYNDILDIYYREDDTALRETELFEINHLERWELRNQLLPIGNAEAREDLRDRLVKTGRLPLKNMSRLIMENTAEEVDPIRELWLRETAEAEKRTIAVDLKLENFQLTGEVDNIFGNKLIQISWSKNENKYLLAVYIQYLALRSMDIEIQTCFISRINTAVYYGQPIEAPAARMRLLALLELYKDGHEHPFLFLADWEIAKHISDIDKIDQVTWERFVQDKLFNGKYSSNDQYLMNAFVRGLFHAEDVIDQYKLIAQQLLVPMAEHFPDSFKK